jgi:hypothetical protein
MIDVLLVQPPIRDFYLTAKRTIPYGLASIAAALIERGFSTAILDALTTSKSRPAELPAELADTAALFGDPDASPFALFQRFRHFGYSFEHIGRKARESGARLVGISSLFTPYAPEALAAAEAVKRWHPRCTVVMGGHHPTAMPETVLASPWVDFVLRGEGEASLPLLAECLVRGGDPRAVPGIGFRRPDGSLHLNPPAVVERLERLPLPAFELLDQHFYRRSGRGSAVVVASRGCPLTCSYCSIGGSAWLHYRRRPAAQVLSEIDKAVARLDAAFIDFEDENLSLDRGWFLELLEGVIERHGEHRLELRAMNGLFPPTLDHTIVACMQRAGFKTLNLSLGATQPEQLERFRRPDVRAAFDRALQLAASAGMNAVGYVIAAAPHQRAEDSLEDLLFLAERRVLAGVSVFYPSPGSHDFERCRRLGVLPAHLVCMRSSALPVAHATSRLEALTLLRLARVVNFMKLLKDRGMTIPPPLTAGLSGLDPKNRLETGRALLAALLSDGTIRGITTEGRVFALPASYPLTTQFLSRLDAARVKGVLMAS